MSDVLLCVHASWSGRLRSKALGPALDSAVDNAWAQLTEIAPDRAGSEPLAWMPYARALALDVVERERRILYLREREGRGAIEAQVWSDPYDTSVILYVPAVADPRLRVQLERAVASLPAGAYGSIFANSVEAPYPSRALPEHLARAPWLVLLPPSAHWPRLPRAVLRRAPATRIEEDPSGNLWIQLYGDPIRPDPLELARIYAWLDRAASGDPEAGPTP